MPSVEERFWAKVDTSGECWVWTAAHSPAGYGAFGVRQRLIVRSHRWAWEFEHGQIPDGLSVLHRCDNPPCVRVDHLFLGTLAENNRDMVAKGRQNHQKRTHCVNGHPLIAGNLAVAEQPNWRICLTCHRERTRSRRASLRGVS